MSYDIKIYFNDILKNMEILQEILVKIIYFGGTKKSYNKFSVFDNDHKRVYRLTLFSNKFIKICSALFSNYNRFTVIIICTKFTLFNPNYGKPIIFNRFKSP